MRISKIVSYDLKIIMTSWVTYFSLLLCILPSFGIAYSIANLKGPFEVIHIIYFFGFFGTLLVVINAMLTFTKDISQNTIILFMNEKSNRIKYFVSKILIILIVGLLFGFVGSVSIYLLAQYANLEVSLELLGEVIIHYILYTLFYGVLFLTTSVFYKNIVTLFIIALITIMLAPTLLDGLLMWDGLSELTSTIILEYLPLYFLPEVVGSQNWSNENYISTIIVIIVIAALGLIKIRKQDY